MNRSVAIVGHHLFADQHRVFVVVAVPGHKGDQHVLTERQFAQVGGGTVGQHVALGDDVALLHDRTLVEGRRTVGTGELLQVVDIHTHFAGDVFFVVHAHDHAGRIDVFNEAAALSLHGRLGVHGARTFDAGTDDGLFRTQAGHALTLHVRTHQSTVRVVMFQERNQGSGNGHDLRRGHVHVLHAVGGRHNEFAVFTGGNEFADQLAVVVHFGVSLSDDVLTFFNGGEVLNVFVTL